MSKLNEILNLLRDQEWTCTSEMAALYTVDARRRLCDLKDKGYILEGMKCTKHDYHKGGTKMWRILHFPVLNRPTGQIGGKFPIKKASIQQKLIEYMPAYE